MSDDNRIMYAADAKECAFVNFAGLKIRLSTFNQWIASPDQITAVIGSLAKLQGQMTENLERRAGYQAKVRQLSEAISRGEAEKQAQRQVNREAVRQYLAKSQEMEGRER
jgi:hypothetical protein